MWATARPHKAQWWTSFRVGKYPLPSSAYGPDRNLCDTLLFKCLQSDFSKRDLDFDNEDDIERNALQ